MSDVSYPITQSPNHAITTSSGQAMIELAVFGSALMVVLAILVRLGMTFQFRQTLQQEAFRKALALSQVGQDDDEKTLAVDQAVYTIVEDRRIPDPSVAPVQSSRSPVVAQNQVLWGTDLFFRGAEGFPFVFEINFDERDGSGQRLEFSSTEFAEEDKEEDKKDDHFGSPDDRKKDLGLATDTFRFVNRTSTLGRSENKTRLETTRSFVDHPVSGTTPDGLDVTGKISDVIVRKIRTKSTPDGVPVVSELPTPDRVKDVTWTTPHE